MQCTHRNVKDGQNHNVTRKKMLSLSTLSQTQRISCWFSMAELLIHLQGHVAQTYTLILIHHFSSLETCQSVAWENSRHLATLPLVSPPKWRLRNEHRNSILMTHHYPDLGGASDWLSQISHAAQPIRSTTRIWVVMRHQYGISVPVSQMSFHRKASDGVAKCWLFSQASLSAIGQFFSLSL